MNITSLKKRHLNMEPCDKRNASQLSADIPHGVSFFVPTVISKGILCTRVTLVANIVKAAFKTMKHMTSGVKKAGITCLGKTKTCSYGTIFEAFTMKMLKNKKC